MPLVVFATGYSGDSMNWSGLTDHSVRARFVVGRPRFRSPAGRARGTSGADLPSQPGDVAFVARELLDRSAARDYPMFELVDPEPVTIAGSRSARSRCSRPGTTPRNRFPTSAR